MNSFNPILRQSSIGRVLSLLIPFSMSPLVGCEAESGAKGSSGTQGADGAAGADGTAGTDGAAGADGTDGADGADGAAGTDGAGWDHSFTGTVNGPDGVVQGALVTLHLLDGHAGTFGAAVAADVSGTDGTYTMVVADISAPNVQLFALAELPDGSWQYSFVYDSDIRLSPAGTAITELISWVVHEEGDRSLADFSEEEVRGLVVDSEAAVVSAGTDLTDPDAVLDQVLTSMGMALATAAGGGWSVEEGAPVVVDIPPDVITEASGTDIYLFDGAGEEWDIYGYYGTINDGSSDAYDGWAYLRVDSDLFTTSDFGDMEDDVELVLGPTTLSGLEVTRKLHVDPTASYLRVIESFFNPTSADITVQVEVYGNLGSDESNDSLEYTSSGDDVPDATDVWATNHQDSSDPALGWIFPGAEVTKASDYVYLTYADITVTAGDTVNITHWSIQDTGGSATDLATTIGAAVSTTGVPSDASWYTGMSPAEAANNIVDLAAQNVRGESGVVAPYAVVTITNDSTGDSVVKAASFDGAFGTVLQASSGDSIHLSSSDGTTDTLAVP